jgi:hopene-associated glycosyltransferase HpnB
MEFLVLLSALAWLGVLLAPWQPWRTRERIAPSAGDQAEGHFPDLTILIPARNEAAVIERTLLGIKAQGGLARVILIDDQSTDETAALARKILGEERLTILSGKPLPMGWTGKLWALEQGRQQGLPEWVLLLDADIELAPGILAALRRKLTSEKLGLVSVMAELRMESFWEKLLAPAFIYFFKLLYPFALSNDPRSRIAAAAGGCILLRAAVLEEIGGFAAIRGALIDDCTLARRCKQHGSATWLGLSHEVRSHRAYPNLDSLWNMVARNAFTQLRYSPALLLATTALLVLVFWMPWLGLGGPSLWSRAIAGAALLALTFAYLPTLRYYRRSPLWALALPIVGTLYLLMTWSSAIRYWRGRRSEWKGRSYATEEASPPQD